MLLRRMSRNHLNRPWQPLGLGALVLSGALFLLQFSAATPVAQAADETKTATTTATSAGDTKPADIKPAVPAKNTYGISQVAYINEMIRKGWVDNKVTPSPFATDGEWCRRVYLDILGRIPTVPELTAFLGDRSADKRLKLVNLLLTDDEKVGVMRGIKEQGYLEEYANNWTSIWSVILVGRPQREENQQRSLTNREGLQQYLRRSFQKNRTYDVMVQDLVSATGSNTPGEKDYNGAVNFLTGKMEENGVQATAKTAQIFMGLQVQCTQCHNHPFNEWKQNRFWELNAFFRQTKTIVDRGMQRMVNNVALGSSDFKGEGSTPQKAELYYELRNGVVGVAYPVFVDGTEISKSGFVKEADRRGELAKLIVNSEFMPKSMVNRMWGHFLGYGFTKPIDDMGPHNPPTHPELLEKLANDFRKNSFNIKELIKWIVLSEPYALSSSSNKTNEKVDDPSLGEKPKFSRFYLRQMRAEELYQSLVVSTQADNVAASSEEQEKSRAMWMGQFTIAFGTDEGDDATTFNGTIPQILMMFNGDLVKKATNTQAESFLGKIVHSKLTEREKLNYLFMAALARYPTAAEAQGTQALIALKNGNANGAMVDVWWALLNSNEFIFNH
jgi:hypothetical protein